MTLRSLKTLSWAGEVASQVKSSGSKPEALSSIPRAQEVKENQVCPVVLAPPTNTRTNQCDNNSVLIICTYLDNVHVSPCI